MPMSIGFICAKVTAAGILMLAPVNSMKTCDESAKPAFQTTSRDFVSADAAMTDLIARVQGAPPSDTPPALASRYRPAGDIMVACAGAANTFVVTPTLDGRWQRGTLECDTP